MKSLKYSVWMLAAALVFIACASAEDGAGEAADETAAVAEEGAPMAEEGEAMAEQGGMTEEGAERERPPKNPTVIYFKADPSEADLEWLRESGFVVERVSGVSVLGYFEYNPPPEFRDDPRLDRIEPLRKPPGPN